MDTIQVAFQETGAGKGAILELRLDFIDGGFLQLKAVAATHLEQRRPRRTQAREVMRVGGSQGLRRD